MMETNQPTFEMVAKTFQGLEDVLAEELRGIGALNVEPGRRMVAFEGTLATLYRANMCCRTALRVLKPIYKFSASDPDSLYDRVKEYDWGQLLSLDKSFAIDAVVNSEEFTHSQYVTYRVKDAIVDWFQDRNGLGKRPRVRLHDADVIINVHISGTHVTLSLDSSGESLHKRGWRVAQTEAPINEVLAAGILLKSGWRGEGPLVDPMCGSGTFLVEAALIATGTMPGVFRRSFAFEKWPDFDAELFDEIYNDDSGEHEFEGKIYGSDISPLAIDIATRNLKNAGMARYVDLQIKPLARWTEAPEGGTPGTIVTNPPYGERISVDDMDRFYELIGNRLKNVFRGYHAWIIGYREEYFDKIGLAPSLKETLYNGNLECQLREYVIFEGDYKQFRASGGSLHRDFDDDDDDGRQESRQPRRQRDRQGSRDSKRQHDRPKGRGRWDDSDFDRRDKKSRNDRSSDRRKDDRRKDEFRPKNDRRKDERRRNDDRKRYDDRRFDDRETPNPENPLAMRRNPRLLGSIGAKPSLAAPEEGKVFMRERRGRKPRISNDTDTND